MNKLIKTSTFFILIVTLIATSSCLNNKDDKRTAEVEKSEITKFLLLLKEDGNEIDTTASGMYYIIHQNGAGEFPQKGDTCSVEYVGYFINGVIFDASKSLNEDGLWEYIYKYSSVIPGFEEAIGMMKTDEEATFIIPSDLAYGPAWYDIIPPYTPLVFDINLHDIRSKIAE